LSRRKQKYKPKSFESTGKSNDTSANIFDSMLTHPDFMGLKTRQKILYVYCKNQFYGKRKPRSDFPEIEKFQSDECFYMNLALVVEYGLYTKTGRKEFYSDMKALCEAGFIECISNGKSTKSRSIYRFSDKWKS